MKNPYKLNTHYFGTHQIIARQINNISGETVLDVGCNEGYLKTVVGKKKWYGIDFSMEALKKAKKNGYKKVIHSDLNKLSKLKSLQRFNIIVFGDVLEHLVDPSKTINYFVTRHLKKGRTVIVSLPNVAHLPIRISLLVGKFNYTQSGILDKTHLHFFTKKTAINFCEKSGLTVKKISYSSNRFGLLIKIIPALGTTFGHNLIMICQKDT